MKLSFSLCCLFSALLLYPLGSQGQVAITPGMVKQAKAMGASNAQINAAINATGGGGGNASAAPAASATATSATPSNTQVGRSAEGQAESSPSNSETSDPTRNTEAESREGENPENLLDKERATSPISRNIFGREIFSTKNLTFAPSYNMPTPPSYVLGPGDEVIIEVWGESETRIQQKISPEGSLSIQGIGPVSLNGLTVSEAQQRISAKMSQIMNGQVKVSLGEIRSIKINISGEVSVPGTYTLPSLATLFNAIYSAGGVNEIGSLRHIQVYRNSKLIADLDVYDYLIYGKYETNIRLEDNDMIIVPPYENHVQITGKVKRERTFELKKGEKLQTLLDYAGGFAGDAYADNLTVYRQNGPTLSIQNVEQSQLGTFVMADGDQVRVGAVLPVYLNMVTIGGAVWRPGEYELSDQVRTLSQLIAKAEGLMGSQFASRGQISRLDSTNTYTVIPFDVTKVAEGAYDIPLANQDQ
ncbi:MAG: polysaccharide export protein, partial [Alistipes sp.]|nr:polysaccharide export protein [Alistipes sp.]